MKYQAKLNEKYTSALHLFHVLKVLLLKSYKVTTYFVCCCFTSAFTLADIIFNNFLELHITSEKRFLSQISLC